VPFGARDQCLLQPSQGTVEPVHGVAHPKAEIGRHLVIARPCRVQASAGIADQRGQPRLHVHVDVFQGRPELEPAGLNLLGDNVQPFENGTAILGRDNFACH
jgi:hypothetical protein